MCVCVHEVVCVFLQGVFSLCFMYIEIKIEHSIENY